jgi:Domain of unknown function (DUF4412)
MKTHLTTLLACALITPAALADWVITQKISVAGQPEQTMTTKCKDKKTRMDMGTQMSMIMDSTAGNMLTIMHEQKMVMKSDTAQLKAAMEMAKKAAGAQAATDAAPVKPEATGQKEKVGDYECEIYTWKSAYGNTKMWIAKDYPHFAELNQISDEMQKAMGGAAAGMAPAAADLPGMVIKTEAEAMGQKTNVLLVSANEEAVDEKAFEKPEGYQEMAMPAMPSGAAPASGASPEMPAN